MEIKIEGSGLKMKDNALTEALLSGNWGFRFCLKNDEATSKTEFILTYEETKKLANDIEKALNSIKTIENLKKENKK